MHLKLLARIKISAMNQAIYSWLNIDKHAKRLNSRYLTIKRSTNSIALINILPRIIFKLLD